jgi:predicted enzyme related to lactoylglutathione lyase
MMNFCFTSIKTDMSNPVHSKIPNGKICYIEIPSVNITESAAFYKKVFGWNVRTRNDGAVAFDDTTNGVSGTWSLNRTSHGDSSLMVHIMVDDVSATLELIVSCGGNIVEPVSGKSPEFYATFSDPSGNIFGIAQQ